MKYLFRCFVANIIFYLPLLHTPHVFAHSLALEAGEHNLNLVYQHPVADVLIADESSSPLMLNASLLYTRQNAHQDLLAAAGFALFAANTDQFKAGAGMQLIAADPLADYLGALAFGGELVYLPAWTPQLQFEASWYYAGEALTFADASALSLLILNMDFEFTKNTFFRFGYRRITTELNQTISVDFDRGVYFGLLWRFQGI